MKRKHWTKALMYFRSIGAGTVLLENKTLKQKGSRFKYEKTGSENKPYGIAVAAKTPIGSALGGIAPGGWGLGIYPVWRKILMGILVNPVTLKWLFKHILGLNKNRQN